MNQGAILQIMLEYFQSKKSTMTAANISDQPVTSLLKDSLDVVDFLMYMEEKLGLETGFDMNQFGPSVVNCNFQELAAEISNLLSQRGAAPV